MLFRSRTGIDALLNTIEHEKHARGALLVAFAKDLRSALPPKALESTRDLFASAERGEATDADVSTLLSRLRALSHAA